MSLFKRNTSLFLLIYLTSILGNRKNITYPFCSFSLPFFCVAKILTMLRHSSVFGALNKNKLKLHLWVSYLFPTPLYKWLKLFFKFFESIKSSLLLFVNKYKIHLFLKKDVEVPTKLKEYIIIACILKSR